VFCIATCCKLLYAVQLLALVYMPRKLYSSQLKNLYSTATNDFLFTVKLHCSCYKLSLPLAKCLLHRYHSFIPHLNYHCTAQHHRCVDHIVMCCTVALSCIVNAFCIPQFTIFYFMSTVFCFAAATVHAKLLPAITCCQYHMYAIVFYATFAKCA